MARTALNWSVKQLAEAAKVSTNTIVRFERGEDLKARTVADIRETFETAGIVFIDGEYAGSGGPGVRLTVAET
ncbi:multiprotein-bridging factor 1 family protein [Ensifer sp. P24N7]|uniref:helix-turn-helix domain-containing protein n=1 Tax=Sinorhizobium sp. P24N7 TaxID=3348358 RepID=UPI0035F43C20